ncbi:MAG: hypothetical protein AB1744_16435, partial [Candidatus Zixiibacteriota bacterium]
MKPDKRLTVRLMHRPAHEERLSHKSFLLEINPIRVEAELVSAVKRTALGATQGRPLRDEKDEIVTSGTASGRTPVTGRGAFALRQVFSTLSGC